jgi:hypothetical protein
MTFHEVSPNELRDAVEGMHKCSARLVQSVPVIEMHRGASVLTGHPKAARAYAWSSPIEGSDKRRFFAVLHVPPITSPLEGVWAALVAEHKTALSVSKKTLCHHSIDAEAN